MFAIANQTLLLAPGDYWRLTPAELSDMLVGAAGRTEREWERTAWMTAHLLNIAGKSLRQAATVDRLLGRKSALGPRDPVADAERLRQQLEAQFGPMEG